jgi:hypothetical protein
MKREDRPGSDAESVAWNSAENQRAGRHAWAVDHDTFARAPDLREEAQVAAACAAWACQNAHAPARLVEPFSQRQQKSIDSLPRTGEHLLFALAHDAQGGVRQNGQIRSGWMDGYAPF